MEADPQTGSDVEASADRLAALKHRHRNQVQAMNSLVGLFGRRSPPGDCRDAFQDLRARFEALGFLALDEAADDDEIRVDLPALAERLVALMNAHLLHDVVVAGRPVKMRPKTAEAACQLLTEMTIALFRRGLPRDGRGSGRIVIELDGDRPTIDVRGSGEQHAPDQADELGWTLAKSHARNCGAELVGADDGAFDVRAAFPPEGPAR